MTDESVVSRIQKLLSLALNNPNPAEAEAAMVKARELMLKHAIEESRLAGKEAPQTIETFVVDIGRYFESWMKIAQVAIARLYDAQLVMSSRTGYEVATFVCTSSDIELLKETHRYIISTILRESAKIAGGRGASNSFRLGAANGFAFAINEAKKQPEPKIKGADAAEVTAIVLARSEAVEKYTAELFPKLKHGSFSYRVSDSDAYHQGYALGRSLDSGKVTKKIE